MLYFQQKEANKMITLLGVLIIGGIIIYTYIVTERQEIQKKQEALQRENEILQEKLKEQELKTKEETFNRFDSAEV
jgi:uncharacterized membrane protein